MTLEEVAPGLHRAEGMGSWHLLVEDGIAVAFDAGLPKDAAKLDAALHELGDPPLVAVLLTHGHVDHIGFAEHARTKHEAQVLALEHEADLIARPLPGPKPERSPLAYLRHASARAGLKELTRGGATWPTAVRVWTKLRDGADLEHLPGSPQVLATPGHTPGHACFLLPRHRALIAGDALVTFDPYTGAHGPRLMAKGSTWSSVRAEASVERLATVDADLLLPGHGPVWRDGVAEAARQALATEQG